jgi:hypothetical protein
MRITKIQIKNYRGFSSEIIIDLGKEGKNLLLYGENGSGKSSLYHGLFRFFWNYDTEMDINRFRNIFSDDEVYIKLNIGNGNDPDKSYEWDESTSPWKEEIIKEASKTKGFIDYKSLLETNFVHRENGDVNLFSLLLSTLIGHVSNELTRKPFKDEWQEIMMIASGRQTQLVKEKLSERIMKFNSGMKLMLENLVPKVNEILHCFDKNLKVNLRFQEIPDPIIKKELPGNIPWIAQYEHIILDVFYQEKEIIRPHMFLNEARLTAIGLSIFLASLLVYPKSALRLLFLDDVLIGLEMTNRILLLDVLEKYFINEWQIFLMTYDWVWYRLIRQRFAVKHKFKCTELRVAVNENNNCIILAEGDYLEKAEKFLSEGELKSSVIYLRCEFENILKVFCSRKKILIKYDIENKHTVGDFWGQVKKNDYNYIETDLRTNIEVCLTNVLNPLSHDAYENPIRADISFALNTLKALDSKLKSIK